MRNRFQASPGFFLQRRLRRLRFFPLKEGTGGSPRPDDVKKQEEELIAAQATRKMPQPDTVKQRELRQIEIEATRKMPRPNGMRSPGERMISLPGRLEHQTKERFGNKEFEPPNPPINDDPDFDKLPTISLMVLRDISKQQGSAQYVMRSEVSEAASSAAFVSMGNIGGSILKYGGNLVIQRGFGRSGFGLYTLCLSMVTLAAAIFHLGLDDAMVRYVSIYRTKRQSSSLRGLTIFCTAMVGMT